MITNSDADHAGHDDYAMGRSSTERARLSYQDRMYGPHTEHFLRCAGLTVGMRVLSAVLRSAGLPTPALTAVSVAGDADSSAPDFVFRAVRSLAPLAVASGAATTDEIDGLELENVIAQARRQEAMLYIPELMAAWVNMPTPEHSSTGR